jgi:hypothetical protein
MARPTHRFVYDPDQHLKTWLKRFQAKENDTIPPWVIDLLIEEVKQREMTLDTITHEEIKKILEAHRLYEYLVHIPLVFKILTGKESIHLNQEQEEKLFIYCKSRVADCTTQFSIAAADGVELILSGKL